MTGSGTCASVVCFPPSRYTGKERDTESGNDYFEARYYSSNMGRFMCMRPSKSTVYLLGRIRLKSRLNRPER
jgi:RHS repeat-associated protein